VNSLKRNKKFMNNPTTSTTADNVMAACRKYTLVV
jgi:hypothetical protein